MNENQNAEQSLGAQAAGSELKGLVRLCPDCSAEPGQQHQDGCDVERCAACGGQAISCGCDESEYSDLPRLKWEGRWPGEAECEEFGWFSIFQPFNGWIRCAKDTPCATHDLNRLAIEGIWDRNAGRFRRA